MLLSTVSRPLDVPLNIRFCYRFVCPAPCKRRHSHRGHSSQHSLYYLIKWNSNLSLLGWFSNVIQWNPALQTLWSGKNPSSVNSVCRSQTFSGSKCSRLLHSCRVHSPIKVILAFVTYQNVYVGSHQGANSF